MSEEALRGWYWAGVIVFALAVLVAWYMLAYVPWAELPASWPHKLLPATYWDDSKRRHLISSADRGV